MKAVNLVHQGVAAPAKSSKIIATTVMLAVILSPQFAYAATGNVIQAFLDAVIAFLNSGVMRSLGILAVISMGIAAYLGKISWELAMKIGGGLVLTFGAAALVDQFSGYVA